MPRQRKHKDPFDQLAKLLENTEEQIKELEAKLNDLRSLRDRIRRVIDGANTAKTVAA